MIFTKLLTGVIIALYVWIPPKQNHCLLIIIDNISFRQRTSRRTTHCTFLVSLFQRTWTGIITLNQLVSLPQAIYVSHVVPYFFSPESNLHINKFTIRTGIDFFLSYLACCFCYITQDSSQPPPKILKHYRSWGSISTLVTFQLLSYGFPAAFP